MRLHAGGVFEDMSTGSGRREGVFSLRQFERKLSMTRLIKISLSY